MITITKYLEIDTGHRLMNHEGKCANVHGHRYKIGIECAAEALDSVGRIIDFGVIKAEVGKWLDDNWDHGFVYQHGDFLGAFMQEHSKCFPVDFPPTAENMAMFLLRQVARPLLAKHNISVVSVVVWETPTCFAEARD